MIQKRRRIVHITREFKEYLVLKPPAQYSNFDDISMMIRFYAEG
jgi:hypothetical protein